MRALEWRWEPVTVRERCNHAYRNGTYCREWATMRQVGYDEGEAKVSMPVWCDTHASKLGWNWGTPE